MRLEPTSAVSRADRVQLGRPATMRDPSRPPVDVVVRDLSETGALLEAEAGADLPVGTLVRGSPVGVAVEFMLPLDPRSVATAGRAETVVSVAIPQLLVPLAAGSVVDSGGVREAATTHTASDMDGGGLRYNIWLPLSIAVGLLLLYLAK